MRLIRKSLFRFLPLALVGFLAVILLNILFFNFWQNDGRYFSNIPIKIADYDLNDLGIVDVNQDGKLDIFTTNHSAQQSLLIGNGSGEFDDLLAEWGLSQDRNFSYLEISNLAPPMNKSGLYIYRQDNLLHLVLRETDISSQVFSGTLTLSSEVEIIEQSLSKASIKPNQLSSQAITNDITFSIQSGGHLAIKTLVEIPHRFKLNSDVPLKSVYIGRKSLNPNSNTFILMWRDRHSMAWADLNEDRKLDVFVGRGGIKGRMHELPEAFYDELFIHQDLGFEDQAQNSGLSKDNCPGRQAAWVDYDQDGFLDIYHACGRGSVDSSPYPHQLFRQVSQEEFVNVAQEVGLDLPKNGEFIWLDIDQDNDLDLLATQDQEFAIYTNQSGRFTKELIGQFPDTSTKKFSMVDYDLNGSLDIYISGRQQNFLLVNNKGNYQLIEPSTIGLPNEGLCGNWVDYDNDGLSDFYAVPTGLYHQKANHHFEVANALMKNAEIIGASTSPMWGWNRTKLRDVRCSWFDFDNNGSRDLIVSSENVPSFRERLLNRLNSQESPIQWKTQLVRNTGFGNHWLEIVLQGTTHNSQAIGAIVKIFTSESTQMHQVGSSEGSYFSQGHYRLYFGLGQNTTADIEVKWPNGKIQTIPNVPVDQLLTIEQKV